MHYALTFIFLIFKMLVVIMPIVLVVWLILKINSMDKSLKEISKKLEK